MTHGDGIECVRRRMTRNEVNVSGNKIWVQGGHDFMYRIVGLC